MTGIKYGFWTMIIISLIFSASLITGIFDLSLLLVVPIGALFGATIGGIVQKFREFSGSNPTPTYAGATYGFWVFAILTLIFMLVEAFFSGVSSDFIFRIIFTPLFFGAIGAVLGTIVQMTEKYLRRWFPPREELEEESEDEYYEEELTKT